MKRISLLAAGLVALLVCTATSAEDFPSKPIRWLVPYAAGGGSDFLARSVGQTLSRQIGQPVLIDNKPGGNTGLAAAELTRSPADGYTVLSADNGTVVFNPALYKSLGYDPKRLAPVTLMGRFPMILVVNPNAGYRDLKDFVNQARSTTGGINYGSAGAGSPHHLAMELFKVQAHLAMVHAPYKGASPALADVVGGQIPAMMVDLAAGGGFIKGGKVRPLAVANATRLPQLPDVPTFAEMGFPGVEAAALVGLMAPAGTPDAVISKLNQEVVTALKDPDVNKRLVEFGVEPVGNSPEQFAAIIQSESARWQALIRDLHITLD